MTSVSAVPPSTEVLGGKYSIVRPLGAGGMGLVYEVRHVRLGQRFAVKMLRPEIARDHEAVTRFEREARAAARLTSRHVCRVTDVGSSNDGTPFMVMEFLEGRDLGAEVEARGKLPLDEAARYLLEACEAMEEAHAQGIIHRDLKPENLFLARDGDHITVKVLDFGISKVAEDGGSVDVTRTQSSIGTPLYMSPEQTRSSKTVDLRADIWSLGVILYETLSGELPFFGASASAVAVAAAVDKHPPIRSYRPDLPPQIEAIMSRALAKSPDDRFQSVREFARSLAPFALGGNAQRWLSGQEPIPSARVSAPRSSAAPHQVEAMPLETATTLHVLTSRRGQGLSRAAVAGLAIVALLTLTGIGAFVLRSGRGDPVERASDASAAKDKPTATGETTVGAAPVRADPSVGPVAATGTSSAPSASAAATAGARETQPSGRPRPGDRTRPSATHVTPPPRPTPTGVPTRL